MADVHRIIAATALHPREFVQLTGHALPSAGFQLGRGSGQQHLVLDRRSSGACVFLLELASGQARCGAYQHRPSACRTFPTILRHGTPAIRAEIRCEPGAWCLAVMDLAGYRHDLKEQGTAWEAHGRIVATWNSQVAAERTEEELFAFLLNQQPD